MADAAAVILAGGRGERLGGVVKGNIEIGGSRLIERIFRTVRGASPVLVARGGFPESALPLPEGCVAVSDAEGEPGPRAGVAGAIEWLEREKAAPPFLLSVAVDTPFFPAEFLTRALKVIGSADAVVGRFSGQDYPTNTLWRVSAVAPLLGSVTSLKQLLRHIKTLPLEWDSAVGENPFANVNTFDELSALKARAAAQFGVGKEGQTR